MRKNLYINNYIMRKEILLMLIPFVISQIFRANAIDELEWMNISHKIVQQQNTTNQTKELLKICYYFGIFC